LVAGFPSGPHPALLAAASMAAEAAEAEEDAGAEAHAADQAAEHAADQAAAALNAAQTAYAAAERAAASSTFFTVGPTRQAAVLAFHPPTTSAKKAADLSNALAVHNAQTLAAGRAFNSNLVV